MGGVAILDPAVLDCLRERLAARPEILEAYYFGSQARGDAGAESDLDIAVYVDRERLPPAPFGYTAGLLTDLMAGLGFHRLDAVILNDAPSPGATCWPSTGCRPRAAPPPAQRASRRLLSLRATSQHTSLESAGVA
jgi:predicted nucleotidyltransferase